jgi:hypothetical protein
MSEDKRTEAISSTGASFSGTPARPVSGCDCAWWVLYFDEKGRKHREKVGSKSLAIKVYQKRKNEIAERRFFPERIRRRDVLIAKMVDDYLSRVKGKLAGYADAKGHGELWKAALGRAPCVRSLRATSNGHSLNVVQVS